MKTANSVAASDASLVVISSVTNANKMMKEKVVLPIKLKAKVTVPQMLI